MQTTSFTQKVFRQARKIPWGKVSTYVALARKIGAPGAARAVGNALNSSPGMPSVPCRRVVKSNGEVGGFASGTKNKIVLLRKEGVQVKNGKMDLKKYGIWL